MFIRAQESAAEWKEEFALLFVRIRVTFRKRALLPITGVKVFDADVWHRLVAPRDLEETSILAFFGRLTDPGQAVDGLLVAAN